ncbi:MAG TPA: 4a-hydroxytetrahydrobiopterin dehydratase [Gammaproteobacteria bacterium]
MSDLDRKHCVPCEGGVPTLSTEKTRALLANLHHDWQLVEDGSAIERTCRFRNYHETIAFVNAAAWIAHREDHHPDLSVHYSRCVVRYSTHAVGDLTENDFICARQVDRLLPGDAG